jgi:hypothetical protein
MKTVRNERKKQGNQKCALADDVIVGQVEVDAQILGIGQGVRTTRAAGGCGCGRGLPS